MTRVKAKDGLSGRQSGLKTLIKVYKINDVILTFSEVSEDLLFCEITIQGR